MLQQLTVYIGLLQVMFRKLFCRWRTAALMILPWCTGLPCREIKCPVNYATISLGEFPLERVLSLKHGTNNWLNKSKT
jgi:hypothetical protein